MKIAIIGAGIAGLTAARELTRRGLRPKVYEKSRGLGGRLATKRLDWADVDIGAQYFTARDPRFVSQVAHWQARGIAALWQTKPATLNDGELITRPNETRRYVGTPKMNSLAHDMARGIDIDLGCRITGLEKSANKWMLMAEDGSQIQDLYDWVVLSLPAEQSRALAQGTVLAERIPDAIHEPCWALALATKGKLECELEAIFADETVSWLSRLSARPEREKKGGFDDLWMLHFSGEWSRAHPKGSLIDLPSFGFQYLSGVLRKYTPDGLELVNSYQHYWRYAKVPSKTCSASSFMDRSSAIAAIGDWTMGGRVEGAYLSALNFIDFLFEENA